ncbi:hypothetical protein I6A60_00265 [Frankia sp. AgB1.9]|uniref:hypothetical protein n=1 Tax=unclassified Frankia TaxID=2632575 RepID=UPI00193212CA|nr:MULTISPECIES: hypothetical protein [unclassified Frankia]MBL7487314.1 hypothetical protein [Frankia sp. AgW1.1]MBL7546321.1 hypothetical protein [Frankia sp. AgB1.9]MBL7618634.1 hypothetical protein [Frankia sp. AgB1.8]
MDLDHALRVVDTEIHLSGSSDDELVSKIQSVKGFNADKDLAPAVGLESGVRLRPVEALHMLSYVTRPRYQDDLLDLYLQWGRLRYLGFFDLTSDKVPQLCVSEPGRGVVGNQRRVTSEELGIGFGALLSQRWFERSGVAGEVIRVLDIDVAFRDGHVRAGGERYPVKKAGVRRPDYLLIADDASVPSRYRVRAVECKGTKYPAHAIQQLASAVEQLGGLTVDGRVPAGMAVSTILADNGLRYLALDPQDEDEPSYEVRAERVRQVRGFRIADNARDVDSGELVDAGLPGSWAMLADFAGNLPAVERWAPRVMRQRLDRRPRERPFYETPFGTARGTSATFAFEGQRLTLRCGVEASLDQQLSSGDVDAVLEVQAAFARRLTASKARPQVSASPSLATRGDTREVHSAMPDGSIYSLIAT